MRGEAGAAMRGRVVADRETAVDAAAARHGPRHMDTAGVAPAAMMATPVPAAAMSAVPAMSAAGRSIRGEGEHPKRQSGGQYEDQSTHVLFLPVQMSCAEILVSWDEPWLNS